MHINYFSIKLEKGKRKLEAARWEAIQSLRAGCGPADTLVQTSSLWNYERINSCGFTTPSLGYFVMEAPGNNTIMLPDIDLFPRERDSGFGCSLSHL